MNINAYYRHPTTYSRRAIFGVNEVAPTIRGVNRPKPRTYKHHPRDAVSESEMHNVAQLSFLQRALIQTFPQNYQFENLQLSRGDLEQMIGNAVPVNLAHFVASRIQEYINTRNLGGPVMEDRQAFSEWLRENKKYSDRSISDVFSRLNRANTILPNHELNHYYIPDLEQTAEFEELDVSVKSQIRKAIRLKMSYLAQLSSHNEHNT